MYVVLSTGVQSDCCVQIFQNYRHQLKLSSKCLGWCIRLNIDKNILISIFKMSATRLYNYAEHPEGVVVIIFPFLRPHSQIV